jgi:hypothetical protein
MAKRHLTDEFLHELLAHATPMGAFCLGIVVAMAYENDLEPDGELMREAARSESVAPAVELFNRWAKPLVLEREQVQMFGMPWHQPDPSGAS